MHKLSLNKIYGYCRWNHKYPPDDWTVFGISIRWQSPQYIESRFCFFGFEIRIKINRTFINKKQHGTV